MPICCAIAVDCWSVILGLLMSGDREENPGPDIEEMLEQIMNNLDETSHTTETQS